MKLVTRFLSLCILLLSGYGPLSAHTFEDTAQKSVQVNFSHQPDDQIFIIKSASSGTEKENTKLEVSVVEYEEEVDKLVSSKKHSESSSYFIILSHDHLPGFLSHSTKTRLSFNKHFSYFSSFRSLHLLFSVFRL